MATKHDVAEADRPKRLIIIHMGVPFVSVSNTVKAQVRRLNDRFLPLEVDHVLLEDRSSTYKLFQWVTMESEQGQISNDE